MYDIENKKFFISRHLIFHEDTFPFHQINSQDEITYPFPELVFTCSYWISFGPTPSDFPIAAIQTDNDTLTYISTKIYLQQKMFILIQLKHKVIILN